MLNHNPSSDLSINNRHIGQISNQRGIRQGAPSSPVLFNLIPYDLEKKILNLYPDIHEEMPINSLHFADDTSIIAETMVQMNNLLEIVQQWAE